MLLRALILGISICIFPAHIFALTLFNDGQIHNLDYVINDHVHIEDNIDSPFNPTVANILPGGIGLNALVVSDNSVVNFIGGVTDYFSATDNSIVNFIDGSSGYSFAFSTSDSANMTMMGGRIGYAWLGGQSFEMYSGLIELSLKFNGKTAEIYDGIVNSSASPLTVGAQSQMFVYGGDISTMEFMNVAGDLFVYGGNWEFFPEIYTQVILSGDMYLFGTNFNYAYGIYDPTDNLQNITGLLSDGTPFSLDNIDYQGGRIIILGVTEPKTTAYFIITVLLFLAIHHFKFSKNK